MVRARPLPSDVRRNAIRLSPWIFSLVINPKPLASTPHRPAANQSVLRLADAVVRFSASSIACLWQPSCEAMYRKQLTSWPGISRFISRSKSNALWILSRRASVHWFRSGSTIQGCSASAFYTKPTQVELKVEKGFLINGDVEIRQ